MKRKVKPEIKLATLLEDIKSFEISSAEIIKTEGGRNVAIVRYDAEGIIAVDCTGAEEETAKMIRDLNSKP